MKTLHQQIQELEKQIDAALDIEDIDAADKFIAEQARLGEENKRRRAAACAEFSASRMSSFPVNLIEREAQSV